MRHRTFSPWKQKTVGVAKYGSLQWLISGTKQPEAVRMDSSGRSQASAPLPIPPRVWPGIISDVRLLKNATSFCVSTFGCYISSLGLL